MAADAELKSWIANPFVRSKWSARSLSAAAGAVVLLLAARPSWWSVLAGLPLVVGGEALRIWAAGHLHKTRELAISGPYARVRHPLYLGTLLIASGFCLMAGGIVGAAAAVVWLFVFFAWYLPRKEGKETERLARRHGAVYAAYRAEVPALIPRLSAWKPPGAAGAAARWSLARVRENDELGTCFLVALLLVFFSLEPTACVQSARMTLFRDLRGFETRALGSSKDVDARSSARGHLEEPHTSAAGRRVLVLARDFRADSLAHLLHDGVVELRERDRIALALDAQ